MIENFKNQLKDIRLKPILIPPEHGIWGFTIEAILLGLFLSEGISKYFIAIMMLILPFAKQTLKIYLQDVIAKRTFLRKYVALFFLLLFFIIFILLIYIAYKNALYEFWYFVIISLILGVIVVILEIKDFYKHIFTEILGSFIPVFLCVSMNTAMEFQPDRILFLLIILGFRNISSIILVKELIEYLKTKTLQHYYYMIIAIIIIAVLFYTFQFFDLTILYILIVYTLLFVIIYYLIQNNKIKKAQTLGWIQIVIGIIYVVSIIVYDYQLT